MKTLFICTIGTSRSRKPICEDGGFDAECADDVYRPGVILHDISAALGTANLVIAEISPVNANVFYEFGYAPCAPDPYHSARAARRRRQCRCRVIPVAASSTAETFELAR